MHLTEIVQIHDSISKIIKPKAHNLLGSFRKSSLNKSATVYHYTNAQGLKGIIEGNSIWATDIGYLNDREEVDHGITERNRVLNTIIQSSRNSPQYKDFANGVLKTRNKRGNNSFVSCFTRNGDQLSQWRGYSNFSMGYSIGFDREALHNFFKDAVSDGPIYIETFDEVIYQNTQKSEIVNLIMQDYYD